MEVDGMGSLLCLQTLDKFTKAEGLQFSNLLDIYLIAKFV